MSLGGISEDGHEWLVSIFSASEEEKGRLLLSEDGFNLIFTELEDGRYTERLDPVNEGVLISGTRVSKRRVLQLSEESNTGSRSTVGLGTVSITAVDESDTIFTLGERNVSIGVKGVGDISEVSDDEFVLFNLGLEGITGYLSGRRTGLLHDPLDNGVLGTSTSVFLLLSINEPEECWEALDSKPFTKLLLLGSINLGKGNGRVALGEDFGGSGVFRSELLAMATPWCIELNECFIVLSEPLVEVIVGEDVNAFVELGVSGESSSGNGQQDANLLQHFSLYLLNWI
jgi:hypothetical protein